MQHKKNNIYKKGSQQKRFLVAFNIIKQLLLSFLFLVMTACSDFVEVDPPQNTLISQTVFNDPETVKSALANMYFNMREEGMVSGNSGLSVLMSTYTDELDYYSFSTAELEMFNHNVTATNAVILSWWNSAYNLIYAANDIIEGLENTTSLSLEELGQFKGQALFMRAFVHSLLASVFGNVPYITSTSYIENNKVTRMPVDIVYENCITDLKHAVNLLDDTDPTGAHLLPNESVAHALLARLYLYTEQWELAEATATLLIDSYTLESDINNVFLKGSTETLWQFKPNGTTHMNTYEANQLIIRVIPGQSHALNDNLLNAFEAGDLRSTNWIGSTTSADGLTTLQYANKYKALFTETQSLEHSIIFRLTEQYLIRAESKAHLGDILGAQQDLNRIRNRAGLANTIANSTTDLLEAVLQERHVEFFTEHGHRWFDLKRMNKANELLGSIKTNWKPTDILLPIPDNELGLNPNLKPQNDGY